MTTLPTFAPSGALSAVDGTFSNYTASTTSTLSHTLPITAIPSNLINVDTLSFHVSAKQTSLVDDSISLTIKIIDPVAATTLAGTASGPSSTSPFQTVGSVTSTSLVQFNDTFTYVDTAATREQWARAEVWIRQVYTTSMGADGGFVSIDWAGFDGTYTASKAPPATPVILNPADLSTVDGTVSLQATVSDPDSEQVRAEWGLWQDQANNEGEIIHTFAVTGTLPRGAAWDGSNIWIANNVSTDRYIRKYQTDGTVLASFLSPNTNGVHGLTWDGFNLWCSYNDTVYKLNSDGSVATQFFVSSGAHASDLAWDGTNIWFVGGTTVGKLNSSGVVLSTITAPGANCTGLEWDGQYLWTVSNTTDIVYQIDATGTVLKSFPAGRTNPLGLAWDGSNLWLTDSNSKLATKYANAVDLVPVLVEDITPNASTVVSGTTHTTSWDSSVNGDGNYSLRAWAFNTSGIKSTTYDEHDITIGSITPPAEWVFRLTVTDDDGATHSVLVSVPIEEAPAENLLPWLGSGMVRPWLGSGVDTWKGVVRT